MAAPLGFRCAGLLPCAEVPAGRFGFAGGRNGGAKPFQIYRFGEEVKRTCLERFHCVFSRAMRGDHDATLGALLRAHVLQNGRPIPSGKRMSVSNTSKR